MNGSTRTGGSLLDRLGGRPQEVALASVGVGLALTVAKLAAGLLTGSLGLISEGVHSGLDVVASALAYLAVRTARKPADREHPYGHGRAENLAAFSEGVLLVVTALGIAYEAVKRLASGFQAVDAPPYAIALVVVALLVEGVRSLVLRRAGRVGRSQALEADAENRLADVLSSAGVLLGLVLVRSGYWWADPVAALLVAVVVAVAAVRILRRSGDILIDTAPAGAEDELRRAISGVAGVRSVLRVRVRRSGPHLLGEAHISTRRTLPLEAAGSLTDTVRAAVDSAVPNLELTLVVQGEAQAANLVERVHAAAARQGAVHDLHNVTVEREDDGSLHLSMHAKLPGHLTLAEASEISAALEAALREEFPEVSRVDVHLEPLEPALIAGEDVTGLRSDLVTRIRALVEAHPEVTSCGDVELSSRSARITAHVVARMAGDVSLEHAHLVETQLEEELRRNLPEVVEVVARALA